MPETDILNATVAWEEDIEDSMTPDYGFTRDRKSTLLRTKAVGGSPWSRETQNTGHSFSLSWIGRSWACVQRLKWYWEQYEDGFFTIIDHDGGGRHFVGRFTGDSFPMIEKGNSLWDVQGLAFEEMPGAPMVTYPSDWDHDGVLLAIANDFGDQKVATSGAWTQATAAAASLTLGGFARTNLSTAAMTNPGTTAGDWVQYEYRGYGFRLYMLTGPGYGKADVYLDGVLLQTVDCYAAANTGPVLVLTEQNVSLDLHRVKVMVDATKNASASAANIAWYALEVMR